MKEQWDEEDLYTSGDADLAKQLQMEQDIPQDVPHFTGYADDSSVQRDYGNSEKTVQISDHEELAPRNSRDEREYGKSHLRYHTEQYDEAEDDHSSEEAILPQLTQYRYHTELEEKDEDDEEFAVINDEASDLKFSEADIPCDLCSEVVPFDMYTQHLVSITLPCPHMHMYTRIL